MNETRGDEFVELLKDRIRCFVISLLIISLLCQLHQPCFPLDIIDSAKDMQRKMVVTKTKKNNQRQKKKPKTKQKTNQKQKKTLKKS